MANAPTAGGISKILSNPSPDSPSDVPDVVVQVIDLKATGNRYMFTANDGDMKLKAILPSNLTSDVISGNIQNLGLIRILDYSLNDIPNKPEKYLIVTKCEVVSPALEKEVKTEVKKEEAGIILKPKLEVDDKSIFNNGSGILLKPKQELVAKSAAQIVHEQRTNMAPAARMSMTRRVHPLVYLNPYQGDWTIKVRVTDKGNLRTYKNAQGEGCVFNVVLTDEDGTQIQATMFNDAAKKFYEKFSLGKVYYISRGTLKVANKKFKTVQNDYEMTLNVNSQVDEVSNEAPFVPETKYNFVKIDMLGPHVNGRDLVDVIGVVQSVSPTMSIRRKINNETAPKRDVTIADETKKTVVISLWNDLATTVGQELLDIADQSPIIAVKYLRAGDFQGVSLSTISRSSIIINPDIKEAHDLRSWYDSEGKAVSMSSVSSGLSPSTKSGARSMYSDRISLSHILQNKTLGEEKPIFFSIRAYVSFIKPDQTMWYRACKTCNKKVTEAIGSGYWCENCQKNDEECSLRYIMVVRVSDASGEAWFSTFNEEAERIIGCSADELDQLKSQIGEENAYQLKLKEATWVPQDVVGGSAAASPYASHQPSPCASFNPSPGSSSFPSPASSSYVGNPNADGSSLIPWLKNLSTSSSSASSSKLPNHYIHGGSISAPVTPPLSSPTARTPRLKADWEDQSVLPGWSAQYYSSQPSSTPPSPGRQILPNPEWFAGLRIPQGGPNSPTFSLVSTNPFGFKEAAMTGGGSRMWTPGQSGTCSPAIAAGSDHTADIPMSEVISDEFAFGSNAAGIVKPWEGERIHEECGSDDLELTLGNSRTR